jgi:TPR repeat protein
MDARPGPYLKALLQKRPTGHHVPFCRLMLAHCHLSYAEDESGCTQDIKAAKKEYMALAEEGFGPACYAVGNMYFEREEVWFSPLVDLPVHAHELPFEYDLKKGRNYMMRSVVCENPIALNEVALRYKNGDGFPVDKRYAMDMFKKAAHQGDARAMINVGRMLLSGDGVIENREEALMWYRRARDECDWPSARLMLWQFSLQGIVSEREGTEGLIELRKSRWFDSSEFLNTYGTVLAPHMLVFLRSNRRSMY